MITALLCSLVMSFQIGPSMGALVPVQDEGDPWRTSFVLGLKARYGTEAVDVDAELQFAQLGIDPDSSRGYDYSMVLLAAGASRTMAGVRWGLGASLYPIEAKKDIDEETQAVWNGTFPGMYVLVGKDFDLPFGTADVSSKFNIIDFDGLWIGLTGAVLF